MERLLLRPAEVGEALGVSRAQAYVLIQKGIIPSVRIGSSVRVPAEELQEYIRQMVAEQSGRREPVSA